MVMNLTEIRRLQESMRARDWGTVYAMLDSLRDRATNQEDIANEVYWRAIALQRQERYDDALAFLRENASLFNCQCLLHQMIARSLDKLGRSEDALAEMKSAPIDQDMNDFYGLAMDAKFFYFYLLAKSGDQSVLNKLSEIPDDYRHITMAGKFLTKADIISLLNRS